MNEQNNAIYIAPYLDQVAAIADMNGLTVLEAYKAGGVAISTYYRNRNGESELRLKTAEQIAKAVLESVANGEP